MSAIIEFAKLSSVDDVFSIYEVALTKEATSYAAETARKPILTGAARAEEDARLLEAFAGRGPLIRRDTHAAPHPPAAPAAHRGAAAHAAEAAAAPAKKTLAHKAWELIRKHPKTAVTGAVGLGAVGGYLHARHRMKKRQQAEE